MSWREEAACRTVPQSVFFPERANCSSAAKQVCASCTVRAECLDYAIANDCCGVWGGLTDRERQRLTGRSVPGRSHGAFVCKSCGWLCMGWRGQKICNGCRSHISETRAS